MTRLCAHSVLIAMLLSVNHAAYADPQPQHWSSQSEPEKPNKGTLEQKITDALEQSDFPNKEALKEQLSNGIQGMDQDGLTLLQDFLQTEWGDSVDPNRELKENIIQVRLSNPSSTQDPAFISDTTNTISSKLYKDGLINSQGKSSESDSLSPEVQSKFNTWVGDIKITEMASGKSDYLSQGTSSFQGNSDGLSGWSLNEPIITKTSSVLDVQDKNEGSNVGLVYAPPDVNGPLELVRDLPLPSGGTTSNKDEDSIVTNQLSRKKTGSSELNRMLYEPESGYLNLQDSDKTDRQ